MTTTTNNPSTDAAAAPNGESKDDVADWLPRQALTLSSHHRHQSTAMKISFSPEEKTKVGATVIGFSVNNANCRRYKELYCVQELIRWWR